MEREEEHSKGTYASSSEASALVDSEVSDGIPPVATPPRTGRRRTLVKGATPEVQRRILGSKDRFTSSSPPSRSGILHQRKRSRFDSFGHPELDEESKTSNKHNGWGKRQWKIPSEGRDEGGGKGTGKVKGKEKGKGKGKFSNRESTPRKNNKYNHDQQGYVSSVDDGDWMETSSEEDSHGRVGCCDSDGLVECRCGASEWRDDKLWIQCGLCNRWEHKTCAHPKARVTPENHSCWRCTGEGRRGNRRLARGAHPRSPMNSRGVMKKLSDDTKNSVARKSKRLVNSVLTQNGAGRRRNVISPNEPIDLRSSSSEDDVGMWIDPGQGDFADRGLEDEEAGDDFFAPEGQVEMKRNIKCKCGATNESEGVGGSSSPFQGAWLVCSTDVCEVSEHATCWGFRDNDKLPRHWWCMDCDPEGRKNARAQEANLRRKERPMARKRELRQDQEKEGASPSSSGPSANPAENHASLVRSGSMNKEEAGRRGGGSERELSRCRLWGAVWAGKAESVESILREQQITQDVEKEALNERLHQEDGSGARAGARRAGAGPTSRTSAKPLVKLMRPLSNGLTVLMLAAGAWVFSPIPEKPKEPGAGEEEADKVVVAAAGAGVGA
ncbi:unnamed protein product, partial [Discosporangium mesarthrocarpum]